MREIIFKWAEMRELSENAYDSREMCETWQVCAWSEEIQNFCTNDGQSEVEIY